MDKEENEGDKERMAEEMRQETKRQVEKSLPSQACVFSAHALLQGAR